MKWRSFVASLSSREWKARAQRELAHAIEEGQGDDVLHAVAACRTLEAMGFSENAAIRIAEPVHGRSSNK